MKFIKNLFLLMSVLMMLIACAADNSTEGSSDGNSSSDKITSLQAVVDRTATNGTIDLSQYPDITKYNANIGKALTVSSAESADLNKATLTVSSDGVQITNISNASVTASSALNNGSLKISSSSLNSLNVLGGGINSIHILDTTVDTVKLDKKSSSTADPVRLALNASTKVRTLSVSNNAVLDSEDSSNTTMNIDNVTFDMTDNSDSAVAFAVSAVAALSRPDNVYKVAVTDSDMGLTFPIYVPQGDRAIITTDFFTSVYGKVIGTVSDKESLIQQANDAEILGTVITGDMSLTVSGAVNAETVTITTGINGKTLNILKVISGTEIKVSDMDVTNDGYVFGGWTVNDTDYDPNSTVTVNANMNIEFIWTPYIGDLDLTFGSIPTDYKYCVVLCAQNNLNIDTALQSGDDYCQQVSAAQNVSYHLKDCNYAETFKVSFLLYKNVPSDNTSDCSRVLSGSEYGELSIRGIEKKGSALNLYYTSKSN